MSAVEESIICVPAPSDASPELFGTTAALDSNDEVVVKVGQPFQKVALVRWKLKHSSGAAANYTPYIFSKTGAAIGSVNQEAVGANTLVADLFDPEIADAPVYMQADGSGQLYMVPGPNAGVNNVFLYMLKFRKVL